MMYGNEPVNVIVNPLTKEIANSGLSKREYFAAMAMQGILSNADGLKDIRRQSGDNWPKYEELVSGFCTLMADALIEALNKTK